MLLVQLLPERRYFVNQPGISRNIGNINHERPLRFQDTINVLPVFWIKDLLETTLKSRGKKKHVDSLQENAATIFVLFKFKILRKYTLRKVQIGRLFAAD
jgi:hypothetical protein